MSPTTVLVEDKTPGQPPTAAYSLALPGDRLTVRELIGAYVEYQVKRFNEAPVDSAAHCQAAEEQILNPARKPKYLSPRDCKVECDRAYAAFNENRMFVLIDDVQVENLDEIVALRATSKVSFVRLVPLVGG